MGIRCCYKCEDRVIGCHATCERYNLEKKKIVKAAEEAFKQREAIIIYSRTRRKKGKVK